MQQYFIKDVVDLQKIITMDKDASHHMMKVMRNRVGDSVRIISGGIAYTGEVETIDQSAVQVRIIKQLEEARELTTRVTIALGLLKGEKLELAIQKCTELGMHAFIPWQSTYAISKIVEKKVVNKQKRWQIIAHEAAEQCQRHIVPQVISPSTTNDLVSTFPSYDIVFVAYEGLALEKESIQLSTYINKNILCIIGPEGGISPKELEIFKNAGAKAISLGSRILRAETAALFIMSLFSANEEIK